MTMKAYDEWKKENPDWDKDWSQGLCYCIGEFKWTDKSSIQWME